MASYQKVIVVGNLGREPEMRYTPAGTAVCSFSVAANRTYMNNAGEKVEEATWYRVTAWGKQAENCQKFLAKGSLVLVEGRLTPDKNGSPRIWTNKEGAPAASFELNAAEVVFLSRRADGTTESVEMGEAQGEDIPF